MVTFVIKHSGVHPRSAVIMTAGFKFERPCLSAGKALRFLCACLNNTVMTNSKTLKITVTASRNRKPKVNSSEVDELQNQLCEILGNPLLKHVQCANEFRALLGGAIKDLSRI